MKTLSILIFCVFCISHYAKSQHVEVFIQPDMLSTPIDCYVADEEDYLLDTNCSQKIQSLTFNRTVWPHLTEIIKDLYLFPNVTSLTFSTALKGAPGQIMENTIDLKGLPALKKLELMINVNSGDTTKLKLINIENPIQTLELDDLSISAPVILFESENWLKNVQIFNTDLNLTFIDMPEITSLISSYGNIRFQNTTFPESLKNIHYFSRNIPNEEIDKIDYLENLDVHIDEYHDFKLELFHTRIKSVTVFSFHVFYIDEFHINHLPKDLESLTISRVKLNSWSGSNTLKNLTFEGILNTDQDLNKQFPHLQMADLWLYNWLGAPIVLPDHLQKLTINTTNGENRPELRFPELPPALSGLSIDAKELFQLPELPESLDSFSLKNTSITELGHFPEKLLSLELINNDSLNCIGNLPDSLQLLTLSDNQHIDCIPNETIYIKETTVLPVCTDAEKVCTKILSVFNQNTVPLSIYPNPAKNQVRIEWNVSEPAILSISDISGKIIRTERLNNGFTDINVSQLPKGLYIVQLQTDQHMAVSKLIVQ